MRRDGRSHTDALTRPHYTAADARELNIGSLTPGAAARAFGARRHPLIGGMASSGSLPRKGESDGSPLPFPEAPSATSPNLHPSADDPRGRSLL